MIDFKTMILVIRDWIQILFWFLKTKLLSDLEKDMEIIALRSQLSIIQQEIINHKISKPHFKPAFRQLWVWLSKVLPTWKSSLILVKPETVICWHKTAFKNFWRVKSRKSGRPPISLQTIALIKRIHKENPLLSPEKIHERLVELAISDAPAPNTIAKYISKLYKTPTEKQRQSWKIFLKNHCKGIWSMDFFVVPTLSFNVLYVLLIISHDRRRIEHFAVTSTPSSIWVSQQIREATPYCEIPDYLIHDNDCTFTSMFFQEFLKNTNIKSKRTSIHSPWQNGICERTIGIIRQELLNHIIPFNKKHLEYLLSEFINKYYNSARTHQGIDCRTPILKDKPIETTIIDTTLESEPILGGLYYNYRKVA